MNALLIKYYRTIDQLPTTARSMILATVLGLIFIIWYYGFWQTLHNSATATTNKIESLKPLIAKLEEQAKNLEKELKEKKAAFGENAPPPTSVAAILSPHKTSKVLNDMLMANSKLVLIQLKNIPPKETVLPQNNSKIFEHGIVVKFSGDYFSTMHYLETLEKLKWKIFWDKLEYKVTQYPMAEITLSVHTISNTGDWIHV